MSRLSYEPAFLRHLASALRREARMIEALNRNFSRMEKESGVCFPVEKSTNVARIENLNDAAEVIEALAAKRIVAT